MKPPPAVSAHLSHRQGDQAQSNQAQNNREAVAPSNHFEPITLGIDGGDSPSDLRESRRQCRLIAKSHYENFLVASFLLPQRLRQPFYDVYAFCRVADDLADESGSPELAGQRLDALQHHIERTLEGKPPGGIFLALGDTIEQFGLSAASFHELIDAFRQDQRVTRYESDEQLADYCRRSANPVGHLVLQLGECDSIANRRLSDDICTGLQLANFWQDIKRDFAIGRVYLPQDAMRRHGVTEAMLASPPAAPELRTLLSECCDRSEELFYRGLPLAERVPRWLAADIRLFSHGGLATLRAIRAIDFDVLTTRPTVSKWTQLRLLTRAAFGRL